MKGHNTVSTPDLTRKFGAQTLSLPKANNTNSKVNNISTKVPEDWGQLKMREMEPSEGIRSLQKMLEEEKKEEED